MPKKAFGGNPHLWMKWKESGQNLPTQKCYMDKYAMRLEFGELSNGKLPAKIYLCLPDQEKSFIRGTLEVPVKE